MLQAGIAATEMAAGDHRGVRGGLHADRAKAVVRILLGVLGPPRSGRRADAQAQGRALRLRGSAWVTHPHVAVAPHQLAGHELCVEDPRALPHLEPAAAKCGNRQARRTVAWNEDPIPDPTDNVGRIVPMHPTSVNIVQGCARCFPSVVAAWLIWSRAVTTSAHMPLPASGRVLAQESDWWPIVWPWMGLWRASPLVHRSRPASGAGWRAGPRARRRGAPRAAPPARRRTAPRTVLRAGQLAGNLCRRCPA
mmetsp:Transcript_11817/g.35644  ORF Transcript_11817/g.35644 Transcript_11817/m.35644 type:complete len:251 (+) Transcript_11817:242-994(+)